MPSTLIPFSRSTPAARALIASCGVFISAFLAAPTFAQEQTAAPTKITLDNLTPDTIDERTLDNLVAWAKLGGYLQHFNPSEWAWTTNMLAYLRDGFDPAAQAKTPEELATILDRLAKRVAPAAMVWPSAQERPPLPDLRADARGEVGAVVAWRHEGFTPTMEQVGPLFSRRVLYNMTSNEAMRYGFAPDNAYEIDLPGGVRVWVPHANFVDKFGNILPDPPPRERVRASWPNSWDYTTAPERLAAAAYAWGLIEHFHPTIDRKALNWDAALRDSLRAALAAIDRASTTRVIQQLLARTGDAQAEAWDPMSPVPGLPPFNARVINDSFIITAVDAAAKDSGVAPGDQILSIDGVKTADALAPWRARMGGSSPEAQDVRVALAALTGFPASELKVEVRKPGGTTRTLSFKRARPAFMPINDGAEPIREIAPGIVYVDGSRANDADIYSHADLVLSAPGIIFDLRSPFTDLGITTLGWITDRDGRASDQFIHAPIHPDHNAVVIKQRDMRILPNPAKAAGKFVFLVGPGTHGDAEFATLTMQDFDLGFIVGSHTAGAPGQTAEGELPGGLKMRWSGLETRSVSGAQIFRFGVPPDIEVIPTREQIAQGEDPVRERAIEALNAYFDTLRNTAPASPPTPAKNP